MNFIVKFSPRAEETYDAIATQLRQRLGEKFVVKLEVKMRKSLSLISSSPYSYPIIEETTEVRRCVLHKNCSMFYKVYEGVILIICFWDNRQDPLLLF